MNELINEQREQIAQLTAERDALAAQVEALRDGLNQAIELLVTALVEPHQITNAEIYDLRQIEQATPQHHLRQVRAEAGRAGYLQGHLDAGGSYGGWDKKHSEHHAHQYHASILAGKE